MQLSVRHYLLALALVLAIPVQGFAAVTAGLCVGHGQHGAEKHAHEGDMGAHPQHDHDSAPPSTHCAPCVACCTAAAIAPLAPLRFVDERADLVVAGEPPSLVGVALETLDRPPLAL